VEAFAEQPCCTNRFYAVVRSFPRFRKFDTSHPGNLLVLMKQGIYESLDHFSWVPALLGEGLLKGGDIVDVVSALESTGIPRTRPRSASPT
jgi:hypothetical protein